MLVCAEQMYACEEVRERKNFAFLSLPSLSISSKKKAFFILFTWFNMSAAKFDQAVKIVGSMPKDGPVQPTQDDQLKFYGLFKQATIGDVNTSRPGMMGKWSDPK